MQPYGSSAQRIWFGLNARRFTAGLCSRRTGWPLIGPSCALACGRLVDGRRALARDSLLCLEAQQIWLLRFGADRVSALVGLEFT
jgi:hypothetical protein